MAKQIIWHTESRIVDDLVPYDKNPRTLSEKQRKDLEASITKFSLAEIPCVNTDNTIVAGHARLKVMQLLGRGQEEIEVRLPNRMLTKSEFEEYLLRSNKNTGSWDFELLKEFDTAFLLDIGFDDADLSAIWDDVLELEDDEFDVEKELKKAEKTDIKLGDSFALGNHRLMCGDSTNKATVALLFGEQKAQMVYCDSPYNINLDYNKGVGGKANYGGAVDDKKSDTEFKTFLRGAMTSALSVSDKNAPLITKMLFDQVQEKITVHVTKGEAKEFAFTKLMSCALCGSSITADEKFKYQKNGNVHRYVYYGCTGRKDKECKSGYINEDELTEQLANPMDQIDLDSMGMKEKIKIEIERHKKFQSGLLGIKETKVKVVDIDIRNYAKYILREGTVLEKRELLSCLRSKITLANKRIYV